MDQIIVGLSSLLNIEQEILKNEISTPEGLAKIGNQLKDGRFFSNENLNNFIANKNEEYINQLATSGKSIPKPLYDIAASNSLAAKEKELAAQYGISEYQNGLKGLVQKIKETAQSTPVEIKEIEQKLKQEADQLRDVLKNKDLEYSNKLIEIEKQANSNIIDLHFKNNIESLKNKLDYSIEKIDATTEMFLNDFNAKYTKEIKDGKIIVVDKLTGEVVKNKTTYLPENLETVLVDHEKSRNLTFKSLDGGRGLKTTPTNINTMASMSSTDFDAYCLSNNIIKSEDKVNLLRELIKSNKDFKLT